MFDNDCVLVKRERHADERGSLFEMLHFVDEHIPHGGYIYVFSIEPGKRRGDHFHKKKHEWFSCVAGVITVLVEEHTGERHKFLLSDEDPAVLYNAPLTTHTLINEGTKPATVVCYGSKPFDADDPDTFPKVLS